MLVLGVLPLGPYALLEEVVVGLEAKFGGRRDVVLIVIGVSVIVDQGDFGLNIHKCPRILQRS